MRALKDVSGQRFGRLVAVEPIRQTPKGRLWKCLCDCGNYTQVRIGALTVGSTKSCGCLQVEVAGAKNRTHGMTNTKTYRIWKGMKRRCYNKNDASYSEYGGRGIAICDRWRNDFLLFLKDMGESPKGLSIERINNQGNYEPSNCRWATPAEQCRNRASNRWYELNGQRKCLTDWADEYGIHPATVSGRLERGWDFYRALTTVPMADTRFVKLPEFERNGR